MTYGGINTELGAFDKNVKWHAVLTSLAMNQQKIILRVTART
jgi:hypothetical protein